MHVMADKAGLQGKDITGTKKTGLAKKQKKSLVLQGCPSVATGVSDYLVVTGQRVVPDVVD